jgi:Tn3 transposase DDE domain
VRAAERGLPGNRLAAVKDGRLKLKQRDAMAIPRALRELRATIGASLPRVRIEDLLQDVDEWCGFTRAFQPLGGYQPRGADPHRSLLATLIAHGTNLGLAAMSQSVDTLTADALQDTSRWFLRDATIKAANTILVDHHLGRRKPLLLRRPALRGRAEQSARQRLSALFRLLRPRAPALYAHLRPAQRLRHAGDLVRAA